MARDLARMAGRQPGDRPRGAALADVPIPPSRAAVPQLVTPKPVLMLRAEPATPVRRDERGPRFGEHLVPQAGPWCEVWNLMGCRNGSGHFARATVALETQHDGASWCAGTARPGSGRGSPARS